MTSILKNVYIDKSDDIVNKYNNKYHSTIRVKPVSVKPSTYTKFGIENNDKDPKFKVGEHVRISKYKNIFANAPNWSEDFFYLKEVKNTVPWTYVIDGLNEEEIVGMFYKKELQKNKSKEFTIEKVISRKGDKL